MSALSHILIDPIRGRERLWVVFWLYYAFISTVIMGAGFWVAMNQVTLPLSGVTEPLLAGLSALYDIWVNVALWQCAFNGEKRFSGHVIRFFVVLTFAYMIWSWCQPEPATNAAPEGNAIEQMQQMQQLLERLNKGL